MASFLSSVRNKRSVSPVVQRLLELSVHYQQQAQDSQNNAASTSTNSNPQDVNKHVEKKIKALVKQINKSKKNGSVEDLERAILHKDARTRCVTLPR